MEIKIFPVNPFEENSYVYYDSSSHEGIIIDPGMYSKDEKNIAEKYIQSRQIKVKYIILTHGHIDHIMGCKWAKDKYNVPLLMHKADLPLIHNSGEQSKLYNISFPAPPEPDTFVDEGDNITCGKCSINIIHTPGHSPGGICLVDEVSSTIFVGDTIFKNSIGRTDFWGGDMEILLNSIRKKIFKYNDDYVLFPGHYDSTTIGEEKINNPFLN